jgi:hypothetical protein
VRGVRCELGVLAIGSWRVGRSESVRLGSGRQGIGGGDSGGRWGVGGGGGRWEVGCGRGCS